MGEGTDTGPHDTSKRGAVQTEKPTRKQQGIEKKADLYYRRLIADRHAAGKSCPDDSVETGRAAA